MENKLDQGPSTTIPGADLKTHGSVRIIDAMVQEPTTANTIPEEKDTAHYKQIGSFAVVYHKGEEVKVQVSIENNGSVWTKYGYSTEADPRCGADEEKCGNDVAVKLGSKVLGVVKNVEGAPDKTSQLDVLVSSKELDAIAEQNGVHDGEALKGDATLRYQVWSSLKGEDVHVETHNVEKQETTTTAEAVTTTAPKLEETTSTVEMPSTTMPESTTTLAPHHTTTSISIPGDRTELAYTGAETGLIGGAGIGLLAVGLAINAIGKRLSARQAR